MATSKWPVQLRVGELDNQYYALGMGDIEIYTYDNCHLKYHGYCKYHYIK